MWMTVEAVELAVRPAVERPGGVAPVLPQRGHVVPAARRVVAQRSAVVDADQVALADARDRLLRRAVVVELGRAGDDARVRRQPGNAGVGEVGAAHPADRPDQDVGAVGAGEPLGLVVAPAAGRAEHLGDEQVARQPAEEVVAFADRHPVHRRQDAERVGRLGAGAGQRAAGEPYLDLDLEPHGAQAGQLLRLVLAGRDGGRDPRRSAPRRHDALEVVDVVEVEPAAERPRLGRDVGVEVAGRAVRGRLAAKPVRLDRRPLDPRVAEILGRHRLPAEGDPGDSGGRKHGAPLAAMADDHRRQLGLLIGAGLGRRVGPRAVVDPPDHDGALGDQLGIRGGISRRKPCDCHPRTSQDAPDAHLLGHA
ncbi:MAG TPA: hypothetical protein VF469_32345 [Kofleriaceae bacterium]